MNMLCKLINNVVIDKLGDHPSPTTLPFCNIFKQIFINPLSLPSDSE